MKLAAQVPGSTYLGEANPLQTLWQQHGQAGQAAGQLLTCQQPGSTTRCSAAKSRQHCPTCTLSSLPRGLCPQECRLVTEMDQACSTGETLAVMHCSSPRQCVLQDCHFSLHSVTSAVSRCYMVAHLRRAAWLGSGWRLRTRRTELSSTYLWSSSLWNTIPRQMQLCGASAAQPPTSQSALLSRWERVRSPWQLATICSDCLCGMLQMCTDDSPQLNSMPTLAGSSM